MIKFQETSDLPRLNQKQIERLNQQTASNKMEEVIKNLPKY